MHFKWHRRSIGWYFMPWLNAIIADDTSCSLRKTRLARPGREFASIPVMPARSRTISAISFSTWQSNFLEASESLIWSAG